jgi:hypothetical protein
MGVGLEVQREDVLAPPPTDHVIAQTPAPGTSLSQVADDPVTLSVSDGDGFASPGELGAAVQDGVVRVRGRTCDGWSDGSGLLTTRKLVVTASHLVGGAGRVRLSQGDRTVTGTVLGVDREVGVALILASRPLHGHTFDLGAGQPEPGAAVVALGHDEAAPDAVVPATVAQVGQVIPVDAPLWRNLIRLDTPVGTALSGGPLLDGAARPVGMVIATDHPAFAENSGYALGVTVVRRAVRTLLDAPRPRAPRMRCVDAADAAEVLETFADSLNRGDVDAIAALLSDAERSRVPPEVLGSAMDGTTITDVEVVDVRNRGDGSVDVDVDIVTKQPPDRGYNGQTCSKSRVRYHLVPEDGGLVIDGAAVLAGPTAC